MGSIIIATSQPRNRYLASTISERLASDVRLITRKEELSKELLRELCPDWIFLPHWSYIVPPEIYENFRTVVFHMTDLPFGRGGSPLQNLIVRGFETTQLSAIQCQEGLDTGPIYLKEPLELSGSAEDILRRSARIIEEMIVRIVRESPVPVPQEGEIVEFRRRKPEDSELTGATFPDLKSVYNFIRMLDGEGYPPAFLRLGSFRMEFGNAEMQEGEIRASVRIRRDD